MKTIRTCWQNNPKPLHHGHMVITIGDVHGCADHLDKLYTELAADIKHINPSKTTCILLGDLIDRGANSAKCLNIASKGLNSYINGHKIEDIALLGNHDVWLRKAITNRITSKDLEAWLLNWGRKP